MPDTPNAWYVRDQPLEGGLWAVTCRLGPQHPDGTVVTATPSDTESPVLWQARPTDHGLLRVELAGFAAPHAPDCWFVLVPEPKAQPAAVNLVAFTSDRFPAGTVITNYAFATARVDSNSQAGAVRWYPDTGIVHQIFIDPAWRRKQLGTVLLYAASAVHQAHGWADRLHSDGRRTDIGQQFVAGLRHPERIAPRTDTMPPMDPGVAPH